ncbi:GNAT family N-acetyltransferase [Sorangium sp. So ce315]|uniref:GNAT family N-acetyltransferase n=1 Tax=Sorangium sp. So ce315 TaxID=3133299 RepID=UPI003F60F2FC
MTDLAIRRAAPADAAILAANNRAMALETEGKVLDTATTVRGAAALIADGGKGFYLVAERASEVVGQLMVTYEWSDWRNATFWWIQSVYVSPAARRGGVFRALYRRVQEMAADAGDVCGIRLYVETANARAQATYAALGMQRSHYELYELDLAFGSS